MAKRRGKRVGALHVTLGITSGAFTRSLRRTRRNLRTFRRGFNRTASVVTRSVGSMVAKLGGLATAMTGIAGAAGFGLFVRQALKSIDAIAKTGSKLGITTDALTKFHHAAELAGINTKVFDTSLQRMVRRVSEAAAGMGEGQKALKELGLNAAALNRMTADEKLYALAGAMSRVTNVADRLRLTVKLFDTEGASMVNMLTMGEKALRTAAAEADKLGLAVSNVEAAQVVAANDAILKSRRAVTGLGRAIAVELAPFITHVSQALSSVIMAGRGIREHVRAAFDTSIQWTGKFLDALHKVQAGWIAIRGHMQIVATSVKSAFANMAAVVGSLWGKMFGIIDSGVEAVMKRIRPFASLDPTGVLGQMVKNFDLQRSVFRGVVAAQVKGLQEQAKVARETSRQTWLQFTKDMAAFAAKPLPSLRLERWVKDIRGAAQKAAETATQIAAKGVAATVTRAQASLRFAPAIETGSYEALRAAFASRFQGQQQAQQQIARNTEQTAKHTGNMETALTTIARIWAQTPPLRIMSGF